MGKREGSSDNRTAGGDSRGAKRAKNAKRPVYKKVDKSFSIEPGMAGILVTCHMRKDKLATKEVRMLFNQYAEVLYPGHATLEDADKTADDNDDDDAEPQSIEDAFKQEVANLKSKKRYLFFWEPPRYTSRVIPLTDTCFANPTDMIALAKRIVAPTFESATPFTYAIVSKARNNDRLKTADIIQIIGEALPPAHPHTVDLVNPDIVIIVEVLRSICGMSVVRDYYRLRKFNLENLDGATTELGVKLAKSQAEKAAKVASASASADAEDGQEE
ncbi:hypothetical protein BC831DRAFT_450900 [Entophlyctis helioformis]|nr:hypothetical protein BC831DRAFT_450900 [Entophlyctis helioformis]